MKNLTPRQKQVLGMITAYQRERGYPPTVSELAVLMGARSPNAATTQLKFLQKKGAITVAPGVSRGITVNKSSEEDRMISLIKSLVDGDEYAREHAIIFLESRGVSV